jgi:uncharacterized protein YjbI with pentapeptide repeats
MYKFYSIIIFFLFLTPLNSSAQDDVTPSEIKSSDIKKYIKKERRFLRGKYKVDLPSKFKKKSHVLAKRYGNTIKVLNLNSLSLSDMDLRGLIFTTASMIKTDLKEADLSHSDLVYVDFTGADLRGANLYKADLSNAVFDSTSLKGANFEGANLFGAKFYKISDVSKETLAKLRKRTKSYVNLDREPLPDYYKFD